MRRRDVSDPVTRAAIAHQPLPFGVRALGGGTVALADALIAWHTTAVDRAVRYFDAAHATDLLARALAPMLADLSAEPSARR